MPVLQQITVVEAWPSAMPGGCRSCSLVQVPADGVQCPDLGGVQWEFLEIIEINV